jgi:STE24 endopeptidase
LEDVGSPTRSMQPTTRNASHQIPQSLLYATILTFLSIIPSLPLSYYSTFVIEQRHGFNKSTVKLWVTDQLKGWLVGAVVGLPVLAGFLGIAGWAGKGFVSWLMGFLCVCDVASRVRA